MQKRTADAIAPLQAASQSPRDGETDTLLAMALRQSGRADEALARLKRATKRRRPYAPAFHEVGYLLMSLEKYDEAIEALGRGLEIAPVMPQLSVQLGEVFLRRRNYGEAQAVFARADALFGIAKANQLLGEAASAADFYRRCLLFTPDDAPKAFNAGSALNQSGRPGTTGIGCGITVSSPGGQRNVTVI
jgi:tetratricopeptide (TPR) repeat protein